MRCPDASVLSHHEHETGTSVMHSVPWIASACLIPENAADGDGPILLTASFPNVRDWLNLHPLQDVPDAQLICDLNTGKPECYFHDNKHRRKAKSYPCDVFERRSLQ